MLFIKQPITTPHANRKHRRKIDTAERKDLNHKQKMLDNFFNFNSNNQCQNFTNATALSTQSE